MTGSGSVPEGVTEVALGMHSAHDGEQITPPQGLSLTPKKTMGDNLLAGLVFSVWLSFLSEFLSERLKRTPRFSPHKSRRASLVFTS
jgi:hypothetical protein